MKKILIIFMICFLWVGYIFYNSSEISKTSNIRSYVITDKIEYILSHSIHKSVDKENLNVVVRKCAHMFEYSILSILLCILFDVFNTKKKDNIYILFLCLLIADLDEFYQSFIKGRTSHVSDVFIDFIGCIVGLILYIILSDRNHC